MSATRVTQFTCDVCGKQKNSPTNYDLPAGWTYENPAGEEGTHRCKNCGLKAKNREIVYQTVQKNETS